jgi:hypothetical protein
MLVASIIIALIMEAASTSATSANFYHTIRYNKSGYSHLQKKTT